VLGKHLSEEWTRIYSDYMHYDPIVRHLRRAVRPFEWREITFDGQRYPRAAELVRLRADFGFKAGFIVPIPGVSGTRAMVAMSGSRPELTRRNKPALHMMSLYAFETLSDLHETCQATRGVLTAREQEVLTWVAAGKSAWDISELLSIAERTAHEHTQAATRKLGALNRTHAVALALRDNVISI
jgi:LuxR family transcriptional regulator, quorum-sensing system regulator BjaR1